MRRPKVAIVFPVPRPVKAKVGVSWLSRTLKALPLDLSLPGGANLITHSQPRVAAPVFLKPSTAASQRVDKDWRNTNGNLLAMR